jgi:hypothetical protein
MTDDALEVLPASVSVEVVAEDGQRLQLLSAELLETCLWFPETTGNHFVVTLEYTEPVRVGELNFMQLLDPGATDAIRFLAQPGGRYTLYTDPDRAYGKVPYTGVDLADSTGVRVVWGAVVPNPSYLPPDEDGDGVTDDRDNCLGVPNPDQEDIDRNARGDVCDDFDRDGVTQYEDNCPDDPNWDQEDTDGDGVGDTCDRMENRFSERNPWVPWVGIGVAAVVLVGLFATTVRGRKETDETLEGHVQ